MKTFPFRFFTLLVFSLSVVLGCASFFGFSSYTIENDIPFKQIDGVTLKGDLYLPKTKGPKPAVLVVHGGSWSSRSGDMDGICKDLAKAGFVAFNVTYRFAPESLYPKAVEDVRDSLAWLKAHAAKYDIDAKNIAGWGYSAGSHLILLVGLDPAEGLKAIVAGGSPTDLTAWPDSPIVKTFLGVSFKENNTLWQQASPVNHVVKNSPPVFLYHGEKDDLVEIEQMIRMRTALEKQSVPVESNTVSHLGHVGVYLFSQSSIDKGIHFIQSKLSK